MELICASAYTVFINSRMDAITSAGPLILSVYINWPDSQNSRGLHLHWFTRDHDMMITMEKLLGTATASGIKSYVRDIYMDGNPQRNHVKYCENKPLYSTRSWSRWPWLSVSDVVTAWNNNKADTSPSRTSRAAYRNRTNTGVWVIYTGTRTAICRVQNGDCHNKSLTRCRYHSSLKQ